MAQGEKLGCGDETISLKFCSQKSIALEYTERKRANNIILLMKKTLNYGGESRNRASSQRKLRIDER